MQDTLRKRQQTKRKTTIKQSRNLEYNNVWAIQKSNLSSRDPLFGKCG